MTRKRVYLPPTHSLIYHFLLFEFSFEIRHHHSLDPQLPRLSRLPTNADFTLRRQDGYCKSISKYFSANIHPQLHLRRPKHRFRLETGSSWSPTEFVGDFWAFRGPSCQAVARMRSGSSPQPQAPEQIFAKFSLMPRDAPPSFLKSDRIVWSRSICVGDCGMAVDIRGLPSSTAAGHERISRRDKTCAEVRISSKSLIEPQ